MDAKCYFLVYRLPNKNGIIHWDHPTGGLVMETDDVVDGYPVCDFGLATDVIEQRYHAASYEKLLIAEVFETVEQVRAVTLHNQWESEAFDFEELMEISKD